MKIYNLKILVLFLTLGYIGQSCCNCPLQPVNNNKSIQCNVRETTVTQFNPNLIKVNDTTYVPIPEYSIHSFQFPGDNNSSGSTPNDSRFSATNDKVVISKIPFSDGRNYWLAILDNKPQNANLIGDVLIDSIFYDPAPSNRFALLRFAGYLVKLNSGPFNIPAFGSDDADDFCKKIRDTISNISINITKRMQDSAKNHQYGDGVPGAVKISDYANAIPVVLDASGNVVPSPTPPPSQADIDKLKNSVSQIKAIDIQVKIGDMFFYTAKNGKSFIITIVDIVQGTLVPNKKRITMMFNPVD